MMGVVTCCAMLVQHAQIERGISAFEFIGSMLCIVVLHAQFSSKVQKVSLEGKLLVSAIVEAIDCLCMAACYNQCYNNKLGSTMHGHLRHEALLSGWLVSVGWPQGGLTDGW
jgi:hypothetical protein